MSPHKHQLRRARAEMIHDTTQYAIERQARLKTKKAFLSTRRQITSTLIELKRNKQEYDFGPIQLRALDELIQLARKAKTENELKTVHRKTCLFALKKQ